MIDMNTQLVALEDSSLETVAGGGSLLDDLKLRIKANVSVIHDVTVEAKAKGDYSTNNATAAITVEQSI
jgi:hypothetical protein